MDSQTAAAWMLAKIKKDGCLYQDDVVDYLVKAKADNLTTENSEGNLVIGRELLDVFKKITQTDVVWVKQDRYWRSRVKEDEPGREARG